MNIAKTKVMNCKVGVGQVENSGKYPCGICRSGVGDNVILCTSCKKWIHKKCSGMVGRLKKAVILSTETVLRVGEGGGWSKTGCAGSDGGVGGC